MKQQADLKSAAKIRDWSQRGKEVVRMLTSTAQSTQSPLAATLARSNATIKPFWIVNAMQVTADKATIATLATDPSVAGVYPDRVYELPPIKPGSTEPSVNGLEWGVTAVRAPDVWQTFGSRGEGIVVANIDTGVQFDHPALVRQYRGNQGNGTFDHNYNWFDPAHVCTGSAPCDNNNHGTHTMGTMVGQDATGDNQIGVAPGARWIAAKGCEQSSCSTASLLAAGQWVLAPTDLAGNNPRPDLRPNIVNNSWGGGGGDVWYRATVQAWVAAGIFPAFANGNNGPGCNSAGSPGDYDESYGVGAFAADGTIASFSSRGSGLGGITKPNISAPGVNVRSSIPGGGYASFQGTSMATPHVSGVVALLWSAAPTLVGDIAQTKALLSQTAIDTSDLSCGGTPTNNNVWGEGKIDAFASVNLAPRGPTGTLAGLVHTADGQAIAGASVSVQGPTQRSTVADSGGGFSLTLPVGTYDVTATAYGYLPTTLSAQTISVGNTTNVDLSLAAAPSFTLSGTVTGGGQPIAGAGVRLNGSPLSTVTDASGRYSFASVLAGTYSLLVSPTDRCVQSETRSVDVTQNLVADFALAARHDSFGYGCRSLSVAYVDATTPLSLTGDDSAVAVALPFAFPFYGNNYSTAYVSTNGHVNFSALDSTFTNTSLPNTATPNLAIYGFWDDLMVDSSSNILTQSVGTAPNRSFVIEYRNVAFYSGAGRVDFEILLTEDGHVRLQYKALDSDLEKGSSATIGLENAGGTVAFQYAYNEVALLASQAIEFGLASSDTTPPTVALTAPTEGSVLTGIASLSATASDDVGVSRVDFYADFGTPTQALIFSDTQAPYAASWNTITVTQGAHSLTARAFDAAGNAASSAAVNVTIDNPPDTVPPTVVITSPADGALLGRNVQVQVTASDNIAVQSVDLLVDGNVVATRTAAPYQFVWNSALVADGPHELEAIARDPAGNAGSSTPLPVVTDNTVPSLALTAPAPGTIVKGTTSITATASDVTGVDHVEFYVDGALLATDTTAPYAASWNTSAVVDGTHDLSAIALDLAGNSVTVTQSVSSDNTAPTVAITAPAAGATVSGLVNITADSTDSVSGVAQVRFTLDGADLSTDATAPYAASWDATNATPGAHALSAVATDRAGNVRTSSVVSVTVPVPYQYYWFEAEAGAPSTPLRTSNDANASAGRYIDVTPGNNSTAAAPANGRASYSFNVTTAGTFRVWGRTIAPTDDDDSFWVQVDNGTWARWNSIPHSTSWAWDDVHNENNGAITALTFNLTAGSHRITVAYREDGTRLDRVLVTNNTAYVPSGVGPGQPPATPTGLSVSASASVVNATWNAVSGATRYIVKRGASGGPYTQVGNPTATTFSESGLANGQYCYVVAAANNDGVSADSAQVCVTLSGCTTDAQCSDGQYCNGQETCSAGTCRGGTAPNCADTIGCTVDACNEANDSCTHTANNAACDDGTFCNGAETCNASNGCQVGTAPCQGTSCDESRDMCVGSCSTNADCDDGQYCNGQETCSAGACQRGTDQGQACYNARTLTRNQQSGSFNTTGEIWFVINENPNGWQASEVQGRRIYVNGVQVTSGQMPLPAAINGRRYFRFTAGDRTWASWSFW